MNKGSYIVKQNNFIHIKNPDDLLDFYVNINGILGFAVIPFDRECYSYRTIIFFLREEFYPFAREAVGDDLYDDDNYSVRVNFHYPYIEGVDNTVSDYERGSQDFQEAIKILDLL